jgi:hypothetical protein
MFFKKRFKKNFAQIYKSPDTGDKFALIAINGDMKSKILSKFNETFRIQGNNIINGGQVSDKCIPGLLAGGSGALGITAATSGTLFMATANPATLMAIGNGVGSAVIGAGGIVAQAPFIPLAGALMPVVAPLLAFQVLSTIMVLQQFNAINERLVSIEKTIYRIMQRNEAIFIGEAISACTRVDNLENEFRFSNKFNNDMIIRLALLEDKVNPIFERYKYLYDAQEISKKITSEDIGFKQTDAYMSIVMSILDLRIDVLKVKLTIQDNPWFMKDCLETMIEKVNRYEKLWTDIENSPKMIDELTQSLRDTVNDMNGWQKTMPSWIGGKRKERKELQSQASTLSKANTVDKEQGISEVAKSAMVVGKAIIAESQPATLLYWEDDSGKHSYYTDDILIK